MNGPRTIEYPSREALADGVATDLAQHLAGLDRVGPQRGDALLSAVESGTCDHLHGAGDLLSRLDAGDALADGF